MSELERLVTRIANDMDADDPIREYAPDPDVEDVLMRLRDLLGEQSADGEAARAWVTR